MKPLTTPEFIERAKAVHGIEYDYSQVQYVNAKQKVKIICGKHGAFEQIPNNHLNGRGCPVCARRVPYTTETFIVAARTVHGDRYDYSKTNYNSKSIEIICRVHGVFSQSSSSHLAAHGCPKCGGSATSNTEDFVAKAKKIHGSKYDYSKAEYVKATHKISIVCPSHGEFEQTPNSHLNGNGCPICRARGNSDKFRSTTEDFVAKAKKIHGGVYDYSHVRYRTALEKVKIRCLEHGMFEQTPNNHLAAHGCPTCIRAVSSQEAILQNRLSDLGISFQTSKRGLLEGWRELDLYIPEHKLAIEVNGLYWHSEANGKQSDYHYQKTVECKRKGIRLLHFWENEVSEKTDLVMSMIEQRLGKSKRLYARKLTVVGITKDQAKEFLDANHLQGYTNCKIAYGLQTNKGRLAAVMTFGVPYINRNYQWEIKRFACHAGITVVGGASRLWAHFLRTHNPKSVLTYADLRISQGQLYRMLGFSLIRRSKPNYVWVKGYEILSRYQTQKGKLKSLLGSQFNEDLSEKQNMQKLGYSRLFDCGNLVFGWRAQSPLVGSTP